MITSYFGSDLIRFRFEERRQEATRHRLARRFRRTHATPPVRSPSAAPPAAPLQIPDQPSPEREGAAVVSMGAR
jgi:hypothetical protein